MLTYIEINQYNIYICLCVLLFTCIRDLRPQDFERNFLRRWSPEVLEDFVANAMPPVDTMATEAAVAGGNGTVPIATLIIVIVHSII